MANHKSYDESGKYCRGCDRTLPLERFNKRPERNSYRSRCVECTAKAHTEWREKNPEASRLRNLKSKYGLTPQDYFALAALQNGLCAICGSDESGWAISPFLHVDHDHTTGTVRGLLCHACNVAVGLVENGVPVGRLVEYLK